MNIRDTASYFAETHAKIVASPDKFNSLFIVTKAPKKNLQADTKTTTE